MVTRIISLIIGYGFGLFQTAYFIGKIKHIDIREKGSGNAGTTNAMRTLGWKAGVATLIGDLMKAIVAVVVVRLIYGHIMGRVTSVLCMYAGLGVVLGHNYPFYLKFKGGKGIAATGGVILSTANIWMIIICFIEFIGVNLLTRYVSVASLGLVITYLIEVIIVGETGGFNVPVSGRIEIYLIAIFFAILAFWQHRANIARLIKGTENKLTFGKKKE
ncbi:MAG: glycerol-3-phosphate 1-O-acyltransferase PlsY [Lachnospiraceae bacterium]|jgi:glycerol-3-phosphate acyltransferase PlsY|nr:glycerol-3-phosphate 1-O-acyltransferase PlsY [Lachnospiraceae bacterium]